MVNKWEVYFCNLNPVQGSEQRGKRPVLVVSNNMVNHILPISTVLPLSSVKKGDKIYPTEVFYPRHFQACQKTVWPCAIKSARCRTKGWVSRLQGLMTPKHGRL